MKCLIAEKHFGDLEMRVIFNVFAFCISIQALGQWSPPPNPNPRLILSSAREDVRVGKYDEALAKHVWFHKHALEIDRSYFGVRLSGALGSWHELCKLYPPALKKIVEVRNETMNEIINGREDISDAFLDVVAINDVLGQKEKTVEFFTQLDKTRPMIAREVYDLAQPALVGTKNYLICNRYLEPDASYIKMVESRQLAIKSAEGDRMTVNKSQKQVAEQVFLDDAATLIALLVLNKRRTEASQISDKVRRISQHVARDKIIDAAMQGHFPAAVE